MLSVFPELLFLSTFAPLAMRIALVAVLALTAWQQTSRPGLLAKGSAFIQVVAAAALIAGAWTQPTALAVAIWLAASVFVRDMRTFPRSTVALAVVMALSLVVTGPGAFSFDLPL